MSVSEDGMRRRVYIGCFCSPWGGLLSDPVVQRHTKMRRKRQDPTDRTEGEARQKMERHMTKWERMKRKSRDREQASDIGLVLDKNVTFK